MHWPAQLCIRLLLLEAFPCLPSASRSSGLDVETLNALKDLTETGRVIIVDMDHGTPNAPKPKAGLCGGAGGRARNSGELEKRFAQGVGVV